MRVTSLAVGCALMLLFELCRVFAAVSLLLTSEATASNVQWSPSDQPRWVSHSGTTEMQSHGRGGGFRLWESFLSGAANSTSADLGYSRADLLSLPQLAGGTPGTTPGRRSSLARNVKCQDLTPVDKLHTAGSKKNFSLRLKCQMSRPDPAGEVLAGEFLDQAAQLQPHQKRHQCGCRESDFSDKLIHVQRRIAQRIPHPGFFG